MYQPEVDQLKELLDYSPDTGEFRWKVSRGAVVSAGDLAGNTQTGGYSQIKCRGHMYMAHRLAWLFTYGNWPKHHIDHKNGIRKDNRIANLRECSPTENGQNRNLGRKNTSGFFGVSFYKPTSKWKAQIMLGGVKKHLGYYPTPEQAHQAYLEAKAKLHTFQPIPRSNMEST